MRIEYDSEKGTYVGTHNGAHAYASTRMTLIKLACHTLEDDETHEDEEDDLPEDLEYE